MSDPVIREGGLDEPQVIALLAHHLAMARATSPPCSTHALDLSGLKSPAIRFFSVWDGADLLGVGALKAISSVHGELKSMHTAEAARRRGVGRAMVAHLLAVARSAGMRRVSLETGVQPYFAPARELYKSLGFEPCDAFEGYRPDPNSLFMTTAL